MADKEEKHESLGPIFEAGPGWGEKIRSWLEANFKKKIFPVAATLVLLSGIAYFFSQPDKQNQNSPKNTEAQIISLEITPGEGTIATSRRALENYLGKFPEIKLKPEQKLYIDNYFKTKFGGTLWKPGEKIEFSKKDMEKAVNEALALPESKLEKLRSYLK